MGVVWRAVALKGVLKQVVERLHPAGASEPPPEHLHHPRREAPSRRERQPAAGAVRECQDDAAEGIRVLREAPGVRLRGVGKQHGEI